MPTPISQDQYTAYIKQGYTPAQIEAGGYVLAPSLPPPASAPAAAPGKSWDTTNGDDAAFRRPKLPAGDWIAHVLEIEGPTKTSYGDAIFVVVKADDGNEYSIKHAMTKASEEETARRSLGCLVAAAGAPNMGAMRKGWATPVRIAASNQVGQSSGKPYVRCDYLPAGSAPSTPKAAPSPAPPPLPPASGLPPIPAPAGIPHPSGVPIGGGGLPPMPAPNDGRPAGWVGAWPPA